MIAYHLFYRIPHRPPPALNAGKGGVRPEIVIPSR